MTAMELLLVLAVAPLAAFCVVVAALTLLGVCLGVWKYLKWRWNWREHQ